VQVSFKVQDGQLFVQIGEGHIHIQGAELIEKVATSAVNTLVQQLFAKPIIQLPIQIDTVREAEILVYPDADVGAMVRNHLPRSGSRERRCSRRAMAS
jgi:hypothetical protein